MIAPRITNLATRRVTQRLPINRTNNMGRLAVQQQQRRNAGSGGGTAGGRSEPDMGGPGGQEAYPFTNKKHRSYAAQTAVGSVTALAVLYFVLGGKDKDAAPDHGSSQNPNAKVADKIEKFGRSRN